MKKHVRMSSVKLSDSVKFVIGNLNEKIKHHGVKSPELLENLLTCTFWFSDLSKKDLESLHDDLSILGKNILTRMSIGEKSSNSIQHYITIVDLLEEDSKELALEIMKRSLELSKEKDYSIDFNTMIGLLCDNKLKSISSKFKRRKHAQSGERERV